MRFQRQPVSGSDFGYGRHVFIETVRIVLARDL